MDAKLEALNSMFIEAYNAIIRVEEKNLKHAGGENLSISEFHTLESIGNGENSCRSVGEIAESLHVTVPTVTVAVNRLAKKGYVTKTKSERDARITIIQLTAEGHKMNRLHSFFHEQLVFAVKREFTDEELDCLIRGIRKLNAFLSDCV